MKRFAIAFILSLQIWQTSQASVSITSRTGSKAPKITIRSAYEFEKQISLKVKPDPRFLPSDVFIRKISEMGLYDSKGIRITSGFDVDTQNDLVLAFSGGVAQIIKSTPSPLGIVLTANFKNSQGNFISPPKDSVALYTTAGEKLCFEYNDVHIAAPKMAFVLLLDRSGSMAEVITDVKNSAQRFLKELPKSAECAVGSFNGSLSYHHKYFENCNCGNFNLTALDAEGGTDLYTPLMSAYQSLSREDFKDYQKAVIVITDGQIAADPKMKKALLSAKKDILTFVHFLGRKNDAQLIGLADTYLQTTTDIKASLKNYFHSLGIAYGSQKVLQVHPCGGK